MPDVPFRFRMPQRGLPWEGKNIWVNISKMGRRNITESDFGDHADFLFMMLKNQEKIMKRYAMWILLVSIILSFFRLR